MGRQLQWEKKYRGGTAVYGESIYKTVYWVLMNSIAEKMLFFSYTDRPKLHLW
jgi:outer membrane receptor for ferrienterochelin and colicins